MTDSLTGTRTPVMATFSDRIYLDIPIQGLKIFKKVWGPGHGKCAFHVPQVVCQARGRTAWHASESSGFLNHQAKGQI